MELIVAQQVVVMFLLIGVGIFCGRKGIVTAEATRIYSNFLMVVVMPVMAVNQFIRTTASDMFGRMGVALLLAVISNGLAVAAATLLIPKRADRRYRTERLAATYPNAGFMAFPVLLAVLGQDGLLYGAIFVAVFIIFTWTFGISEASGSREISLKKILLNPGVVATAVGVLLFAAKLPVPQVVTDTVGHIANLNTPLAMVITGVFLSELRPGPLLRNRRVYRPVLIKNFLMPLAMTAIIWLLRVPLWLPGAKEVAVANVISTSCGVAASVILLTTRTGGDASHSAGLVAVSTACCLLSMPLAVYIAQLLF